MAQKIVAIEFGRKWRPILKYLEDLVERFKFYLESKQKNKRIQCALGRWWGRYRSWLS
jgi:hypothetical protein